MKNGKKQSHRLCTHCKQPIVLIPSATERAKKDVTGKSASYYLDLFTMHSECLLKLRDGK